jgi:hypothetical protein
VFDLPELEVAIEERQASGGQIVILLAVDPDAFDVGVLRRQIAGGNSSRK